MLGRYIPIWFIFEIPLNFLFSNFFRYYANLLTQKPDRDDADSAIEGANHNKETNFRLINEFFLNIHKIFIDLRFAPFL